LLLKIFSEVVGSLNVIPDLLGRWGANDGALIWLAALSPAAGFAFFGAALLVWRQGVKRLPLLGENV
jgi:hypothetical protein